MITIVDKDGKNEVVCTKGTYEELYKRIGYRLASKEEEKDAKKTASSFEKIKAENEEENEKISAKYGLKGKKPTTKKEEK